MCGIAGGLGATLVSTSLIARMTDSLVHRGPDGEGVWSDREASIALGHRRLAVVDLSPRGRQPMTSANERHVLTYNGEIYNHLSMRAELDAGGARSWHGHSDTETLLEAIAEWGLHGALERAVGMFALAVWDRQTRTLQLARDRFGEKPLYYGWIGGDFLFASELKALRMHPGFGNAIERRALRTLAARAYIPAPLSIFEHIYKVEPGCILSVTDQALRARPAGPPRVGEGQAGLRVEQYWSYRSVVNKGLASPIRDEEEAIERLENTLAQSVIGQSVADVPIGAFLSGGIDSSTVVALYQKYSSKPVLTFSIGFDDRALNEADHAKAVAQHFGTRHHEHYVTADECLRIIPLLPTMYDEPFADASQVPTHIVSRFAREQVTVALSGDGGDELFGGYNRYLGAARLWAGMRRLPRPMRAGLGCGLGLLPPAAWDGFGRILPGGWRPPHFGTKVRKALNTMGRARTLDDVFHSFLDEWSGQDSPVMGAALAPGRGEKFDLEVGPDAPDAVRMMYCDAVSYLPDDILCKVDRAAMAVSLETRVPFLDHRVAELAARIPIEMKIRGNQGKHILRRLLYREAPAALFERPKAGFGMPLGQWLRGPLRDWAESLLDERRLRDGGYWNAPQVLQRWQEHLAGRRDAGPGIWAILMFEAWREHNAAPVSLDGELAVGEFAL